MNILSSAKVALFAVGFIATTANAAWDYKTIELKDGTSVKAAYVIASQVFDLHSQANMALNPRLILSRTASGKTLIMLSIEGKFACKSGCKLKGQFNTWSEQTFDASPSSSDDTTVLVFDAKRFLLYTKASEDLVLTTGEIVGVGRTVMAFNIGGLKWGDE